MNFFIYAKDYSGSTDGVPYYHNNGLKTVEEFKKECNKIKKNLSLPEKSCKLVYLHWGHICEETDENDTIQCYKSMIGTGRDTVPSKIIEWVNDHVKGSEQNKIKLLYLITDGCISQDRVEQCFKLSNAMYENTVFHAFHEDLECIDLSVAAAFLTANCRIYRNYELMDETDVSVEYDYDKITLENFSSLKEDLKSYIKLKYMKTVSSNVALRDTTNIKKLRNRLLNQSAPSFSSTSSIVEEKLKNKEDFIKVVLSSDWYRKLFSNTEKEIDAFISTLLNYIENEKKSYDFDNLKFHSTFNTQSEAEEIYEIEYPTHEEIAFPDIILNEEVGVPVILLTTCNLFEKKLFNEDSTASFSKFRSTLECPLFLLKDKETLDESIGYFYTLQVYKEFLSNNIEVEPRTRRPFSGGLVLVQNQNFDRYNDYILSLTYFDGKRVNYNIGLFYFVLWKVCEKKEWIDEAVKEQFKKYAMSRVHMHSCKIGLSSLPLDFKMVVPLPYALWYCVEISSDVFKHDAMNFHFELLRRYYGVASYMIEILQLFDFQLDLPSIEKRIYIIKHVNTLKKIPTFKHKVSYILQNIFKKQHGFLISDIENPNNIVMLNLLKYDHQSVLREDVLEEVVYVSPYVNLLHFIDQTNVDTKQIFCNKTLRPYFSIDDETGGTSFYTKLLEITKAVVIENDGDADNICIKYEKVEVLQFKKIVSLFNLFFKYVADFKKYPILEEYCNFVLRKKEFEDDLVTIFPSKIYEDVKIIHDFYNSNIISKISVDDYLKVCSSSVNRYDRIKMEGVLDFKTENEALTFIKNEEKKYFVNKE